MSRIQRLEARLDQLVHLQHASDKEIQVMQVVQQELASVRIALTASSMVQAGSRKPPSLFEQIFGSKSNDQ